MKIPEATVMKTKHGAVAVGRDAVPCRAGLAVKGHDIGRESAGVLSHGVYSFRLLPLAFCGVL